MTNALIIRHFGDLFFFSKKTLRSVDQDNFQKDTDEQKSDIRGSRL